MNKRGANKRKHIGLNSFMMRQEDLIRPTGPKAMPHRARQCSFVATTVLGSALNPALANWQLLPVKTGEIDLDGLKHDRDQLWAEAAHLERQADELIFQEELRPDEQQNHSGSDPWLEVLSKVEGHRKGDYNRISTQELAEQHLEIKGGHLHAYHPKRLGNLMRGLGWVGPKSSNWPVEKQPAATSAMWTIPTNRSGWRENNSLILK